MMSSKKSVAIILITTLFVSGSSYAIFFFPHIMRSLREDNSRYHIQHIVQTHVGRDSIKCVHLAELLHLSQDHPTSLYALDLKKAQMLLQATHAIEKATIKKIKPDTLFIEYQMRAPFIQLADITNTFVDKQGYCFPAFPFYTPKKLPLVRFGIEKCEWGQRLDPKKLEYAAQVIERLKHTYITSIDLSNAQAPSRGRQEIVVSIQKRGGIRHVRLHPQEIDRALTCYEAIEKQCLSHGSHVIDLRLPDMAYFN